MNNTQRMILENTLKYGNVCILEAWSDLERKQARNGGAWILSRYDDGHGYLYAVTGASRMLPPGFEVLACRAGTLSDSLRGTTRTEWVS